LSGSTSASPFYYYKDTASSWQSSPTVNEDNALTDYLLIFYNSISGGSWTYQKISNFGFGLSKSTNSAEVRLETFVAEVAAGPVPTTTTTTLPGVQRRSFLVGKKDCDWQQDDCDFFESENLKEMRE
ncbi:hypothetical protein D6827_00505, partial [Candidatus Parcubacteria bacterium]